MSKKDDIYSDNLGAVGSFSFDKRVVDVFPDMIRRSVPGYVSIITMTGLLAANQQLANKGRYYDLGCSLGASSLSICKHLDNQCNITAVDNSEAMLAGFENIVSGQAEEPCINLQLGDITQTHIKSAAMVVLNFTLQFIAVNQRQQLLQTIYDGLLPGGILVLSEKIHFTNNTINQLLIDSHHQFKKQQGYSDLEIAQKRDAIDNVLIPESLDTHFERLQSVGFSKSSLWFQCLNFCSLVAVK